MIAARFHHDHEETAIRARPTRDVLAAQVRPEQAGGLWGCADKSVTRGRINDKGFVVTGLDTVERIGAYDCLQWLPALPDFVQQRNAFGPVEDPRVAREVKPRQKEIVRRVCDGLLKVFVRDVVT